MISENNIERNLRDFSFPRLSGTAGEKKAFELLHKKIENLNLTPQIQEFSFSTFYARVFPKIIFTLGFWLLFILFLNTEGYFTIINLVIILISFIFLFILDRKPENIKFGKVLSSQNMYVKISAAKTPNRDILLFSHLDSKAQRLTIKKRVLSIKLWLYSFFIGIIIILLKNLIQDSSFLLFYILGVLFLCVNFFATILIDINNTFNKSPGSIDNASGVSCVLELLTYFSNLEHQLNNYNLTFVFTGAEETGTSGIRHFCELIDHLDRSETYVVNFDGIGKSFAFFSNYVYPRKNLSLYKFFQQKAKEIGLELQHVKAKIGVHSDGLYLRKQGFRELGFADVNTYPYVHSINDTIDKADFTLLKKICLFNSKIFKELDILEKNTILPQPY